MNENDYDKSTVLIDDFLQINTEGKKVFKNIYTIKTGDTIDLNLDKRTSVNISVKTDKRPLGYEQTYSEGGYIIVSEEYIENIEQNKDEYILGKMLIKTDNATLLENTINDYAKVDKSYFNVEVTNIDTLISQQNRMVLVISIFLYGFIAVITLIGVTNIFNTITTNMILRSKEFAMLKSIGMTTKEFNKMIRLESILYGLKSLIIGIPIGILGSYFIYKSFAESVDAGFSLPIGAILISIVFVFIIVGSTMRYSLNKINKQNIIETIRKENI